MCKVMMIAGIKRQHQEKVKKLCIEMVKEVCSTDGDGFGYAAITNNGEIYGEKWLNKDDAFVLHSQPKPDLEKQFIINALGSAVKLDVDKPEKVYDSFGNKSQGNVNNTVSVILHARKKTIGEKSIANTHPFVELNEPDVPQTALIHNGSVSNHLELTKKYSTCDSETLLHEYVDNAMYHNPYAIKEFAETVTGEYTVGVLSSITYTDSTVTPVLDIFKSHKDLYVGFVKELETLVFCTSKYSLESAVKAAGMTVTNVSEVNDGFLIRFNAITGERMDDTIPFELSRRHTTTTATSAYDSHRTRTRVNPPAKTNGFMHGPDQRKVDFEARHPELFSSEYYQPGQTLNEKEQEYFKELELSEETDQKALRLVKKIMNL